MINEYFFELSGEHPTMPVAEAKACVSVETASVCNIGHGPGYAVAAFDDNVFRNIAERIALTRRVGRYLGSFDTDKTDGFSEIEIPEGTFAVRARRFEGMLPEADSQDITRKLGKALSRKNDVSLKDPDTEVRVLISDRIHVFLCDADIDTEQFETRKVAERPFFSPISLHPRYARASINLSGAKKGDMVLDPFCGTGGIVLEAASMGMRVIASDIDDRMVAGCAENMEHYGLRLYDSDVIDIGEIAKRFAGVDAVVTDPPYGRSTRTGGEDVMSIHRRCVSSVGECLKTGGKATIVLPYEISTEEIRKEDVFVQRVHGSLSRHYHIFFKR
ncbi:MAG: THUMP domain-containing protein [Methanomassiliicoccaceae archaeon]|nr:THUMP domain-containing protein [Methanomassiliicoccaceae archaeon]